MKQKRNYHYIGVNLREGVHAILSRIAKKNFRTLTGQVEFWISQEPDLSETERGQLFKDDRKTRNVA